MEVKVLKKEIEAIRKLEHVSALWINGINIVKLVILLKTPTELM